MRDEKKGRKKQATKNKAKQHSTPKVVRKMSYLEWDLNPRHSACTLYNCKYVACTVQVHSPQCRSLAPVQSPRWQLL